MTFSLRKPSFVRWSNGRGDGGEDPDRVACPFRLVEGVVGVDEETNRVHSSRALRQAKAGCQVQIRGFLEAQPVYFSLDVPADGLRGGEVHVLKQQAEFVAPVAKGGDAGVLLQHLGKFNQAAVPHVVAPSIVDALEFVHIHHRQNIAALRLVSLNVPESGAERLLVIESCHLVQQDLFLQPLALDFLLDAGAVFPLFESGDHDTGEGEGD